MKTTLKVLAPFGTAVITVIVFYLLGVVFLLLGFIAESRDLLVPRFYLMPAASMMVRPKA